MRLALLAILPALLVPASAAASDVRIDGSTVVYTAGPGERLQLSVVGVVGDSFVLSDQSQATTVAPPCSREPDSSLIRCPAAGLTGARFTGGDGEDNVGNEQDEAAVSLPMTMVGGAGNDSFLGGKAADVLDGGPGNDSLPGWEGDDTISGGPGDDDVRPQAGDDTADGGPGTDWVNGGDGNDRLAAGTGTGDMALGAEGDDRIDMRNGEVDMGEAQCDAGTDTVVLDPGDKVLEYRKPGARAWTVDPTCERVEGQTQTPKPLFFAGSARFFRVDVIEALPTRISVEIVVRGKVAARGASARKGPSTEFKMRRTAAGRRIFGFSVPATVRITIADTGGRRRVTTKNMRVGFL